MGGARASLVRDDPPVRTTTDESRARSRIGRSRAPRTTRKRFYSMSAQIRHELDITPWMEWFFGRLGGAFDGTEVTLSAVVRKARFWRSMRVRL